MSFHNELKSKTLEIQVGAAPTASSKHCRFVADRDYICRGIRYRFEVGGSDPACAATIYKAPSGTTFDAGTALHSSVIDLTAAGSSSGPTASITGTATLSATAGATYIPKGYAIGVVWGSNMTALVGACIEVDLEAV